MPEFDDEIVLVDEEGAEHRFTLYRIVEVDGVDYALLEPLDGADDEAGELVVLRIEGEGDDQVLVTPDEEEWERVAAELDGMESL